ncbi:FxSxx-COOH cyclophane-containing RiPP peptide [Streptomyces sp. NPDC049040]|uniref:FxSxx-COOH cyclophane-containing RiPP peptide n=1 Tax=Streptomyces sp. NPDC049040 TaxID=3365593 RepID=UPI00371112C4
MTAEPPGGAQGAAAAEAAAAVAEEAAPDVLGLDLESLRTIEHPVLAALVTDLRLRLAAPGGEALWGFDNSM